MRRPIFPAGLIFVIVLTGSAAILAVDNSLYVKKATWQESLRASREKLAESAAKEYEHLKALGVQAEPWYTIGPFDKIENTPYADIFGPELDSSLDKSYYHGKLKWVKKPEWKDGVVTKLPGDNGQVVANFLQRVIKIDRDMRLPVYLGSNDGIQVWFNDEKVFGDDEGHKAQADQYILELDFKKGDNKLMLKINNRAAGHAFYFSLVPGGGVRTRQIEEIWQAVENDFLDKSSRRRIRWERCDQIWADNWKPGDFQSLAARYAEACPKIESLAKQAGVLAKNTQTLQDLEKVREIYYRAKDYSEVIDSVTAQIDMMVEEVDYLDEKYDAAETGWQKYKSNMILLEQITRAILGQAKAGNIESLEELTKVEAGLEKFHKKMPVKLPCGPKGPGRFGAYYSRLKYTLQWDRNWRTGPLADVVVRFDKAGCKLVFWRGTNYVPCWVMENNLWYTDAAIERRGGGGTRGACEPMSDKQTRYSHVRILENSQARVVVHWRYSPVDVNYRIPNVNWETKWGDWVDEFYTVYPDGVGIRRVVLRSSASNVWTRWQQSTVINQPRTKPEDNINMDAVIVSNLKGQVSRYRWTQSGAPEFTNLPERACIQLVNIKANHKPFSIFPSEGATVEPYRGHAGDSNFTAWDHWPVSQDKTWIRTVSDFNSPSSTSLSNIKWQNYAHDANSVSMIMMQGITDGSIGGLVPLARSWLEPAKLTVRAGLFGTTYVNHGYDRPQRAYVLSCNKPGRPRRVRLNLAADRQSPVVNPAFIIEGWGSGGAAVEVDGKELRAGKDFRAGHRHRLESSDLVVWLRTESTKPLIIRIYPTAD